VAGGAWGQVRAGMVSAFPGAIVYTPILGVKIPNMGPNQFTMANALFTHSQQKVLGLLFANAHRQFHVNEMLRLTGAGKGALQRELARLESAGLVRVARMGNQRRYQANREAPIFEELRGIVLKTFGLAAVLREALSPLVDLIRAAFVFGSVAKGEDRADSDVDVLVIADDLGYGELIAALEGAEARLGRKVNPAIYSREDWRKRSAEGNAFVRRVLDGPKIWLLGDEDALR